MRKIAALSLLFAAAMAQGVPVKRPDAPPLAQRGPSSVGVRTLQLTDPARGRTFAAEVWYPSSAKDAPLTYDTLIGQTPVKLPGRAARGAAAQAGKFPLVVASHGQPGTRFQFAYLAEHLASRGFVVASLEHTGSTYRDLTQQNYVTSIADRPLDVLFAIGEVAKQVPSADPQNVGLLGYSYGGYSVINAAGVGLDKAALQAYAQASGNEGPSFALGFFDALEATRGAKAVKPDPRVKAVFAMAPYGQPWVGEKSLAGLKVPLFVAAGEADDVATYKRDALEYFRKAGSQSKYLLTLAGAQHNPFVECPPEVRSTPADFERCWEPVWDQERTHDLTMHFAAAFFAQFLKNDASAAQYLTPALTGFGPRAKVGVKLETR